MAEFFVKIIITGGRFMSFRYTVSGLFEAGRSLLMGVIINIMPYPINYGVLFIVVFILTTVIFFPSILFTYLMTERGGFYLSIALFGLAQSARNVNENNLAPNLCTNECNQPLYIGLRNILMGPMFTFSPVNAGVLYDIFNVDVLAVVSTLFMAAGLFIMRRYVKEYR